MRHWIGRSDARALLLLAGLCVGSPVAAHRRLAVGFEGATVAALPSGDVTVWAEPAKLRAKHAFGPDLVSLAASPAAPLVAVLRRTAAGVGAAGVPRLTSSTPVATRAS